MLRFSLQLTMKYRKARFTAAVDATLVSRFSKAFRHSTAYANEGSVVNKKWLGERKSGTYALVVLKTQVHDGLVDLQVVGQLGVHAALHLLDAPIVALRERRRGSRRADNGRNDLGGHLDARFSFGASALLELTQVIVLNHLRSKSKSKKSNHSDSRKANQAQRLLTSRISMYCLSS